MLYLSEVYFLRHAIQKQFLKEETLKLLLNNVENFGGGLQHLLVKNQLISLGTWDTCWQEAKRLETWPENPSQLNLDNQIILQKIYNSQKVKPESLDKALALCQKITSTDYSPRLHDILIGRGAITLGDVEKIVGIVKNRTLECTSCQIQIKIHQYCPWIQYPCFFCIGNFKITASSGFFAKKSSSESDRTQSVNDIKLGRASQKFGRYTLLTKIGEGGMGVVWKCYDPFLQRELALKIIRENKTDLSLRKRFYQEVNLTVQLTHPHIIPIYEVGEEEGRLFFTMPFIKGVCLREYVEKKGVLEEEDALEIMEKLCKSLFYAHEQSVVHRDIKPENIMIDEKGNPYLMDFGLAKNINNHEMKITKTGAIMGSPEYMSPEQAIGNKKISYSADIYALGGTLYFMMAGISPFHAKSILQLLHKVIHEVPKKPTSLNPNIPKNLEIVILKCLQKKEKDRYSHAGILLHDIQAMMQGNPIVGQGSGLFHTLRDLWEDHKFTVSAILGGISLIFIFGILWIQALQERIQTHHDLKTLSNQKQAMIQYILMLRKEQNLHQVELAKLKHSKAKILLDQKIDNAILTAHFKAQKEELWKALKILQFSLSYNSRHELIYYDMGKIHFQMKNYKKSYALYKKSINICRFEEQLYYFISLCLKMNKIGELKKEIKYFTVHYPKSIYIGDIYLTEGKIFLQEKKTSEALQAIQKSIQSILKLKLDPVQLPFLFYEQGLILEKLDKKKEAYESYQKSLRFPSGLYKRFQEKSKKAVERLKKKIR